ATPSTTHQHSLPNGRVTVSSTGGTALSGSLVITLRQGSCTGTVVFTEDGDTVTPGIQPITLTNVASGSFFDTHNTAFVVDISNTTATSYFWSAVFPIPLTSSGHF